MDGTRIVGHLQPLMLDVRAPSMWVLGFVVLLGFDAIKKLGGVCISEAGNVQFSMEDNLHCTDITINEPDFKASFDQQENRWTAAWKWAGSQPPVQLNNCISEYRVTSDIWQAYEEELKVWLGSGWLVPYPKKKLGPLKGLIPLMTVVQVTKEKVHPVLDYRELNKHMDAFTANAPARNGIVERSHQSIKTVAVRNQCSVLDAEY